MKETKIMNSPETLAEKTDKISEVPMPVKRKYVDPKTAKLIDLVRGGKKVRFSYYRDQEFWYEQEDGFIFPVSLAEANTGRATFLAEDKAIFFMRWMKKYIEACQAEISGV